jgi:hypothetical protein
MDTEKLTFAVLTLISTIGSSYLGNDLSEKTKDIIDTRLFRKFVVFCIGYSATRDFYISFVTLCIYYFFIGILLKDDPFEIDIDPRAESKI